MAARICVLGKIHMSQVLEWRERLEIAHKQMHEAMTESITNKNYLRKLSADYTMSTNLCLI